MTGLQYGGTVMRKLVIADADVIRLAIQQEIARSNESRYDHRLHGLLLVTGSHSCQQVAELFGGGSADGTAMGETLRSPWTDRPARR